MCAKLLPYSGIVVYMVDDKVHLRLSHTNAHLGLLTGDVEKIGGGTKQLVQVRSVARQRQCIILFCVEQAILPSFLLNGPPHSSFSMNRCGIEDLNRAMLLLD